MVLAGIVAATFMGTACAVISADSRVGRSAAYAFLQWRRRVRARRRDGRVTG
jgi:hypothetical protein